MQIHLSADNRQQKERINIGTLSETKPRFLFILYNFQITT